MECEGYACPGFNQRYAWLNRLGFVDRLRSKTASTPTPTIRNGNSSSQTSGYSTSASKASGQHSNNTTSHSKKLNMIRSIQGRFKWRDYRAGAFIEQTTCDELRAAVI